MNIFIDNDTLFGNDDRAAILSEYAYEVSLIRRLIEIAEEAVLLKESIIICSCDGVCYLFARSIVAYAKMAYDNMILGHFEAVNMILRTIIENNVCFDIIQRYEKEELWKYYLVQSFRDTLMSYRKELDEKTNRYLNSIYSAYGIEKEFTETARKNDAIKPYAYIDKNYGWTYKINKNFTFSGLCRLIDRKQYKEFKIMSTYSHGTSIYHKINRSVSEEQIMSMISSIYMELNHLVMSYCMDETDNDYDAVADAIEEFIYDYLEQA